MPGDVTAVYRISVAPDQTESVFRFDTHTVKTRSESVAEKDRLHRGECSSRQVHYESQPQDTLTTRYLASPPSFLIERLPARRKGQRASVVFQRPDSMSVRASAIGCWNTPSKRFFQDVSRIEHAGVGVPGKVGCCQAFFRVSERSSVPESPTPPINQHSSQ